METLNKIKDPIIFKKSAIRAAGNASKLAGLLGISRASVSSWGERVPLSQAYRIIQLFPELNDGSSHE